MGPHRAPAVEAGREYPPAQSCEGDERGTEMVEKILELVKPIQEMSPTELRIAMELMLPKFMCWLLAISDMSLMAISNMSGLPPGLLRPGVEARDVKRRARSGMCQ